MERTFDISHTPVSVCEGCRSETRIVDLYPIANGMHKLVVQCKGCGKKMETSVVVDFLGDSMSIDLPGGQ